MALTPEQIDLIANEYLVGVFQEMEQDVISDIARRVRKTGRLTETAELMAQNMANQGFSPAEIRIQVMQALNADPKLQAEIAKNTLEYKKAVAERIDQLVEEAKEAGDELVANAGRMCYNDDLALWREAGKTLNNTALPQIIEAVQTQTQGTMRNLTQTTALALRDASGVEVPIMDGYKRFLDKTTLQVATGTFSYDEAVNRTIKEMAKSGVRYVEYNSKTGRKTMAELDVATRRAVRTGVSQMAGRIMEETVKNSDTDLVITSQHMGSRPEHAEWQNKVFSLTGKDRRYKTLAEGTGYGTVTGLKGANCTHNFYPYWPGISTKEPDIMEPPPVKINGREYTYYQATQKQREYERKLRATKREIAIQEQSGGDPEEIAKLKNEARALSKEYNSFSNSAGIRPKPNRARVVGVGTDNNNFTPADPMMFKHALTTAKTSCNESIRWRVDDYSHSIRDYSEDILLISPGGSTVAVTPTGDIISVCKNQNDSTTRGKELIQMAVKNGGVKLDSFSGNHEFYVKCGFEPVSWCEFDEQYAPPGWVKGRDEPEPIIFYKYTGKKSQYTTASSFLDSVKASDDYDLAQLTRDNAIGGK